jgi:Family of unknown function (DUF5677)
MPKLNSDPKVSILETCDAIDSAIEAMISACNDIPHSEVYADQESLIRLNLVIKNIQAVLLIARNDLLLIVPALVVARAAYETAIRSVWMVNHEDPYEREIRLVCYINEEIKVQKKIADREPKLPADELRQLTEQINKLTEYRNKVVSKYSSNNPQKTIDSDQGCPNFEAMCKGITNKDLYKNYIYLSQYAHGNRTAIESFSRGFCENQKMGDYLEPRHWRSGSTNLNS